MATACDLIRASLVLLVPACGVRAQQYVDIAASLEIKSWRGTDANGEANARTRTISIVCATGTNEWRIAHDWVTGGEAIWAYDGTNVFHRLRITQPPSKEFQEKVADTTRFGPVPFEIARSNLTINVWPGCDGLAMADPPANVAWLAFCSGHYLRTKNRLISLPVDDFHHTRDRFAYTDKTETFADALGLPRKVELFTSKLLFLESETAFDREYFFGDRYTESNQRRAAKLAEGDRTFEYKVSESTNLLGWTLPTRFEFSQKGRAYEQNGDWFFHGAGKVISIRAGAKPAPVFDSAFQQTIVDWRFRDESNQVSALTYTWTNIFLSATDDPGLQEKFASRVAQMVRAREHERR